MEIRWTVEGSTLNRPAITRAPGRPGTASAARMAAAFVAARGDGRGACPHRERAPARHGPVPGSPRARTEQTRPASETWRYRLEGQGPITRDTLVAPLGLATKEIAATLGTLEIEGFARPSRSLSPRDDCGPCPADTAATNKCLAQSNKSCAEGDATIGLDAAADLPPSAAAAFRGARLGLPAPHLSVRTRA